MTGTFKWLVFSLGLLSLYAEEVPMEDIGVITWRRGVALERPTNRLDFAYYNIELKSPTQTNVVTFSTTNEVLILHDFVLLPSGPFVMSVVSVYTDGDVSVPYFCRGVVHRGRVDAPKAVPVLFSGTNSNGTNSLGRRAVRHKAVLPPLPSGFVFSTNFSNLPYSGPLPASEEATNTSYSDYVTEQQKFYRRVPRRNMTNLVAPALLASPK